MQEWHSDGPPAAQADQPYAVCVFVPLLDLSPATGCTQFWPGSHVHAHLLGFGPAAVVLETAVDGLVAAGDAVLYDYRVLHRGLPNECEGIRRDVLQVLLFPSWCIWSPASVCCGVDRHQLFRGAIAQIALHLIGARVGAWFQHGFALRCKPPLWHGASAVWDVVQVQPGEEGMRGCRWFITTRRTGRSGITLRVAC